MNNNTKIIIELLVATLLSSSCLFYFLDNSRADSTPEPDFVLTGVECHDSVHYFAILESLTDANGSKILIKNKTSHSTIFPCTYVVRSDDFEIKKVIAGYFLTFADNFLVLDIGTGPSYRKLIVYDLRSRKEIFTDTYEEPVTVTDDSITYFSYTQKKPTIHNCPKLKDYNANGGAVIISKVTVNLSTVTKKDLGKQMCIATQ